MLRLASIVAAAALMCLLLGTGLLILAGRDDDPFAPCREGAVAGAASIGGPFELVSETGETVTDTDVIDRPTLVYFGYTFCPDVCPFDAARNAEALDLLSDAGHDDVQAVFITVDPARDTPEVLAAYTDYMHPDMLGLTGSDAQIADVSQAYRVYSARRGDDPETYLMDHTVFTYLMLPDTGFVDLFRGAAGADGQGVTAQEVARRTSCFLDNA